MDSYTLITFQQLILHISHLTLLTSHTSHCSQLTSHTSHLTFHTAPISHISHLIISHISHCSHLTPHTSHLTPHISLTSHTSYCSHITSHTSHLTHHTAHTSHRSHLTPLTSHTTHTSHYSHHTSHCSHLILLTPRTAHTLTPFLNHVTFGCGLPSGIQSRVSGCPASMIMLLGAVVIFGGAGNFSRNRTGTEYSAIPAILVARQVYVPDDERVALQRVRVPRVWLMEMHPP